MDSVLQFAGCRAQAQELCCTGLVALCMWDLPGLEIKPVSPALAGNVFTTEPPGKPLYNRLL